MAETTHVQASVYVSKYPIFHIRHATQFNFFASVYLFYLRTSSYYHIIYFTIYVLRVKENSVSFSYINREHFIRRMESCRTLGYKHDV